MKFINTWEVVLTTRSLLTRKGGVCYNCCCFARKEKTILLDRIQDVSLSQGCIQRCYKLETLKIETAGQAGPNAGPEASITGLINARYLQTFNWLTNRIFTTVVWFGLCFRLRLQGVQKFDSQGSASVCGARGRDHWRGHGWNGGWNVKHKWAWIIRCSTADLGRGHSRAHSRPRSNSPVGRYSRYAPSHRGKGGEIVAINVQQHFHNLQGRSTKRPMPLYFMRFFLSALPFIFIVRAQPLPTQPLPRARC